MTLDTPDALLFDQTVTRIAGDLKELGDTEDLDVRRARAVGILADPQHALDLLSGRDGAAPSHGARAGATNLYVHLTPADLAADLDRTAPVPPRSRSSAPPPPGCSPTGSPGSPQPAPRSPCAPSSTSTPTGPSTSTTHPTAMRETVVLRDAHCVFPGCRRDSRACDLDHITEYLPMEDGGPPGQTRPGNLAPLCRTHHRVKTHTAWHYKRLDDGSYVWTAPTGHQYHVTPVLRGRDSPGSTLTTSHPASLPDTDTVETLVPPSAPRSLRCLPIGRSDARERTDRARPPVVLEQLR